jgi:hypothetical protein
VTSAVLVVIRGGHRIGHADVLHMHLRGSYGETRSIEDQRQAEQDTQ